MTAPVTESEGDSISVQFLHSEPKLDQGRSAVFFQLLSVQQIRHDEDERQAKAGLKERPAFGVD